MARGPAAVAVQDDRDVPRGGTHTSRISSCSSSLTTRRNSLIAASKESRENSGHISSLNTSRASAACQGRKLESLCSAPVRISSSGSCMSGAYRRAANSSSVEPVKCCAAVEDIGSAAIVNGYEERDQLVLGG